MQPWRHPAALHVRFVSSSLSVPRRGRNLTERYRTLENATRARSKRVLVLFQGSQNETKPQTGGLTRTRASKTPDTIAGFVIPQEPRAPTDDECCMSGCTVCIYDLYEEALAAYKDSVTTLRVALSTRHIPETEWPAHIRTGKAMDVTSSVTAGKSKDAVFDAFEEMERVLKQKREERAAVEAESWS